MGTINKLNNTQLITTYATFIICWKVTVFVPLQYSPGIVRLQSQSPTSVQQGVRLWINLFALPHNYQNKKNWGKQISSSLPPNSSLNQPRNHLIGTIFDDIVDLSRLRPFLGEYLRNVVAALHTSSTLLVLCLTLKRKASVLNSVCHPQLCMKCFAYNSRVQDFVLQIYGWKLIILDLMS